MYLSNKIPAPWRWTVLAICLMVLLTPFLLSGMVRLTVSDRIGEEALSSASDYDVILILGCGIKDNGEPSDMLADRMKTGIALYQKGIAPRILLSGDHETDSYNEIAVMKRLCLEAGVSEEAILCDRYGLSTYDSMIRAHDVFDVRRAVVVTQEYHLYRALYIAEKIGMESVGVDADIRQYRLQAYRNLREVLARCKDFYMVQRQVAPTYTAIGA